MKTLFMMAIYSDWKLNNDDEKEPFVFEFRFPCVTRTGHTQSKQFFFFAKIFLQTPM